MCLGSIAVLAEAWDDGGARAGRLEDGCVVTLAFVPSIFSVTTIGRGIFGNSTKSGSMPGRCRAY